MREHATESDGVWQPGEVIPAPGVTAHQMDELKTSIHSMIASMQAGISSEFSRLTNTISRLDRRVSTIEENNSNHVCSSSPSTPASSASEQDSVRRIRHTPVDVQVTLFCAPAFHMHLHMQIIGCACTISACMLQRRYQLIIITGTPMGGLATDGNITLKTMHLCIIHKLKYIECFRSLV